MDHQFVCPACSSRHAEPADAGLGHRIFCLDCALDRDIGGDASDMSTVRADPAAIAA